MTLFEADLQKLEARAAHLRRAYKTIGVCAFGLLILALSIIPGGFGKTEFNDVHLHPDVWDYFSKLGVRFPGQEEAVFLGVRVAQLRAGVNLAASLMILIAFSNLIRLQWRAAVKILLIMVLFNTLAASVVGTSTDRMADAKQFGVGLSSTPASELSSLPNDPGIPTFHRVGRARPVRAPQLPPEVAALMAKDCERPEGRVGCAAQADEYRVIFRSDMAQFIPRQRAAMHYVAAQVAFLEHDQVQEKAQLDAIVPADVDVDAMSDWRIRAMQHDLEKHGLQLRSAAYHPMTVMGFAGLRFMAGVLALIGLMLLLFAVAGAEGVRIMSRRVKRLRQMLAPSTVFTRRFGQPTAA